MSATSGPVRPAAGVLRPLAPGEVRLTGGFWAERQELNVTAILPHCEEWLDRVGSVANFDAAAAGTLPDARRGLHFTDSDVFKLLEAMAWEVGRTGDADLDARLRGLSERVVAAQEPDGYLGTAFGRPGQPGRYSDLRWGHELYCLGHLIQAGVARLRTGRPDLLADAAVRAADHVCAMFAEDGIAAVCGHPGIEVALVELARCTGHDRYLRQAQIFVDRRGRGLLGDLELGREYYQDAVPVRESGVLTGHAVRALYLAAGAADVGVDTGDTALLGAVSDQLARTVARRTHLTGGMGSRHWGEAFGLDHELPPDRAYAETCAGVGAVMLAQRLLLANGGPEHADLVERVLYNVVAGAPAADGRSFFYTNPLHQRAVGPPPPLDEPSPRAATGTRAPWFDVPCCPTNVARLLATLEAYLATADDDGVQLHQYAEMSVRTVLPVGRVALAVETDYPDDGTVRVRVVRAPGAVWTLSLRVPAWADEAELRLDGAARRVTAGQVRVTRPFVAGDVVELVLPVRPRWTWPDPRVDALRGQVAAERGPVVLCLESTDAGEDIGSIAVSTTRMPLERDGEVLAQIRTGSVPDRSWPYGQPVGDAAAAFKEVRLTPYHRRSARGPASMRVWMPAAAGPGGAVTRP